MPRRSRTTSSTRHAARVDLRRGRALRRAGRRRAAPTAESWIVPFIVAVVGGEELVATVIKDIVDRARPRSTRRRRPSARPSRAGTRRPRRRSTPRRRSSSGAAAPARARAVLTGGAVGLAVAVAASRVLLDVHWLTDVIGGLALGWAWFTLCAIAFGGRLLRFGVVAEVAEQVAESGPTGDRCRRGRTAPAARQRAEPGDGRSAPHHHEETPLARAAQRPNGPGGMLVRHPGQPADLPSPRAAAAPDRLGARARSAGRRLGRDRRRRRGPATPSRC